MQEQGRYTICEEIASGATATVYLAEDRILRRKVALKKLHPHLANNGETVKRFQKEAVAIASLSHENIIQIYDFGDQDRNLYLAMEYVDGEPLESILARPPRILPNLAALSLLHQLMKGLAAAHSAGIVHRDVKPSNVLVDRRGCVRIADFGIAFLAEESSITKTGSYLGTPVYSSPEQARGVPTSVKTDIFSSGILFYRCITGRLPFGGDNPHAILKAILETQPRKPSLLNGGLFPGLAELTMAMLDKDPARRPAAAACAAELEAVASRMGFPIQADRVRRLMEGPEAYPAEERREIETHFLLKSRAEAAAGNLRKAMKLAALAELYSTPSTEIGTGEGPIAGTAFGARAQWKVVSVLMAATLLAVGLVFFLAAKSHLPGDVAAPEILLRSEPAPPSAPLIPVPAMADQPEIALSGDPDVPGREQPANPPGGKPAAPAPVRKRPARAGLPPPTLEARMGSKPAPEAPAAIIPAGYLVVKSNPPFAAVTVDGTPAGHTPFRAPLELDPGEHEILLEREGCAPLKTRFKVESGETVSLRLMLEKSQVAAQ